MVETVSYWMEAGGPIVIILGLLSVYSIALVVLKLIQFWGVLGGRRDREAALDAWERGERSDARKLVTGGRNPINAVVAAAMEGMAKRWDKAVLREEVERVANAQIETLGRHLRTLEVLAVVSPLMGLLGTVLGMIESFQSLELAGGSANAAGAGGRHLAGVADHGDGPDRGDPGGDRRQPTGRPARPRRPHHRGLRHPALRRGSRPSGLGGMAGACPLTLPALRAGPLPLPKERETQAHAKCPLSLGRGRDPRSGRVRGSPTAATVAMDSPCA